jgi:hypothetical protein
VWDKLRKQIAVELEQLDQLFEIHRPLLAKSKHVAPSDIELSHLPPFFIPSIPVLADQTVATDRRAAVEARMASDLLEATTVESARRRLYFSSPARSPHDHLYFATSFATRMFQLHWQKMQSVEWL